MVAVDDVETLVSNAVSKALATIALTPSKESRNWFERYGALVFSIVSSVAMGLYLTGRVTERLDGIEQTQKTMSAQMMSASEINGKFDNVETEVKNVKEAVDHLGQRMDRVEQREMDRKLR
jgi:hypothetical protein